MEIIHVNDILWWIVLSSFHTYKAGNLNLLPYINVALIKNIWSEV